jgi:hypothetical protein
MESGRRRQTIAAFSAVTLSRLLAAQVFDEYQSDGAKIMSESRWREAGEPGFRGYDRTLDSSKVDGYAIRTQLAFVDVGKDELAAGGGIASDAPQSRDIRLVGQVLGNA